MPSFWTIVNDVIRRSDILLLVLDSRFPDLTRNKEIEDKIRQSGKKILYVLNKCDLITKKEMDRIVKDFYPAVFVSSKKKMGGTILFKKIMMLSKGQPCTVGVLGYPNSGKSSVINLLKGSKAASVSSQSGHTRNIQSVVAKGKIRLLDTPGVLQFKEKDIYKQLLIGAKNPQMVKEPDYYAMQMVEAYQDIFEHYYEEKIGNDAFDFLEKVALKKNVLLKGGLPDLKRLARSLIHDWQTGKIHQAFLEK